MMIASGAFYTLQDAAMKLALADMPYGRAIAIRGVTSCALLLAIVHLKWGLRYLAIRNWPRQMRCAFYFILASFLYVYALPSLPLSVAVTGVYTTPLFTALLAPWLLHERLDAIKFIATVFGFVGVALVAQADSAAISWWALLPVASALAIAMRDVELRQLIRSENSMSIIVLQQIILALCGFVYAFFEPHASIDTSTLSDGLAALASVGAIVGAYLVTEAVRTSEITVISPLRYTAIIWAALLGSVLWGDRFNAIHFTGMALVIISGTIVTLSEHRPKVP